MSDEDTRRRNDRSASRRPAGATRGAAEQSPDAAEAAFDNAGYLRVNPDVADAIRNGEYASGYLHYISRGFKEGRPLSGFPQEPRNVFLPSVSDRLGELDDGARIVCAFESLTLSASGGVMLAGWIDDARAPLACVRITGPSWRVVIDGQKLIRMRRGDTEAALGAPPGHRHGLLGFAWSGRGAPLDGPCVVEFWTADRRAKSASMAPQFVDDDAMRDTLLSCLASADFPGNRSAEVITALDQGFGADIIAANRAMTNLVTATPYVERFGQRQATPQGSIIVVLYGKIEFTFLQNCLYSGLPNMDDYEFVFVCNSPELAEAVLREIRIADLIYGLQQTVVILPGNAGFSAANNVGSRFARSNRLLIVNPDVFPRDRDWARKHTDIVGSVRADRCRLFGVPLYYSDGSLMHGGMYFEIDRSLSFAARSPHTIPMVRVEHFGKGAPPETPRYRKPRPVPAVSGAFISCDRNWFETLGGFTEDYIFGHYEDADLCLKSIGSGTAPWLHDIRMWHLEGKGSGRLPVHEGSMLVNRWLFTTRWGGMIDAQLLGQTPNHPLFAVQDDASAAASAANASVATTAPVVSAARPVERSAQNKKAPARTKRRATPRRNRP